MTSPARPRSAAVLLVDDNPANLLALDAVLSPIGVRTVTALSPKAALNHLQQESFAAALIDVQMPEMDGFQLAQRIRQMDRGRQLPILFITAIYQDEEYISQGYERGAADYITKPFDPNIVRSRVKAFVDLYEQRESVHQRQVATRTRERDEAIRRLVAFERIATAALETSDVRSLLDELLSAFTDAAEAADSAAILLRDGDYLQVRASVGFGDEPAGGFRVRIGEGFAGRVAAERQPVELSDAGSSALIDSHWVKAPSTQGLYGVPLLHAGEVLGVAQIGSTRASLFSEAEKRLFRAAVDRAALAVTRHFELSSLYEILSVAPALIAIVRTPELRYSFVNPAYRALFDAPLDGSSLHEQSLAPRTLEAVERAWRTGETVELSELEVTSPAAQRPDAPERPRYLSFAAHPLRNASGAVDRVLTFAVNVTTQVLARREVEAIQAARAELLERERAARQAAESASLAKDEFLATVSHELRTPLNAILGWATMARSKVTPDLDRALGIIEKSALAQARIVEDVLDFSRIARGQMRLTIAGVDVPAVIRDALLAVGPAAAAKGIRIESAIDVDDRFVCDGPRLQQVVWNLLSNAIKFSEPNGAVIISARLGRRELELCVKDSGQGIEPEFVPYVFEAFRQAKGGSTRRHGGLGLGLAIVKEIVQAHGGTVVASSAGPGQGAAFTVSLPLEGARRDSTPPPPTSMPRPPAQNTRLDGLKILVVEDDDDSREFLAEALEQRGATIAAANGVAAALAKFEPFRPDIVVSDIAMPDADGYDLIRQIRSFPSESGGLTPALALTAHTRAEVRERAREAGFQQLEPKPVDLDRLSRVVLELTAR
ncbi:MAG TPA: response regulator [Polyangiaceae bacterium]|nr:response regulator [Polyangiaceae bacterium]